MSRINSKVGQITQPVVSENTTLGNRVSPVRITNPFRGNESLWDRAIKLSLALVFKRER